MKIIGITGPAGAGKGVIVDYLKDKGFNHFSVRAFITEEILARGMAVNRENMVLVGNELRQKYGTSYCVDELYKRAQKNKKNAIIESIRTEGEVESLRKKSNFMLLAIDADMKLRYERIKKRNSETDKVTFEEFKKQEDIEYANKDKNKQNIKVVMHMADYTLENNGSLEELYLKIDKIIYQK
jgi:dephospho-CoA kinase